MCGPILWRKSGKKGKKQKGKKENVYYPLFVGDIKILMDTI